MLKSKRFSQLKRYTRQIDVSKKGVNTLRKSHTLRINDQLTILQMKLSKPHNYGDNTVHELFGEKTVNMFGKQVFY
jgi:hypothetical protein